MNLEQLKIAEKWLTEYAPRVDRKVNTQGGDFVRSCLYGLQLVRKSMEEGQSYPEALCNADVTMWKSGNANHKAAAQIFWAMGCALQGKEFVR